MRENIEFLVLPIYAKILLETLEEYFRLCPFPQFPDASRLNKEERKLILRVSAATKTMRRSVKKKGLLKEKEEMARFAFNRKEARQIYEEISVGKIPLDKQLEAFKSRLKFLNVAECKRLCVKKAEEISERFSGSTGGPEDFTFERLGKVTLGVGRTTARKLFAKHEASLMSEAIKNRRKRIAQPFNAG